MSDLSSLALQIEAFRVRLAIASLKNDALARNRYLSCLVALLASFYDETKRVMGGETMRHFLVFSERNPDGRIMTEDEYREFTKKLKSNGEWGDLRTHIAVEIDAGLVGLTNRILMDERRRAS